MDIKKVLGIAVICGGLLAFCGCGQKSTEWKPMTDSGTIQIAVLGDDEFYSEGSAVEAMEMAAEDFYTRTGTQIELVFCDDDADYHKTIAYANELAENPDIAAVISKQEMDYVDTVADIFEDAKKPYIVTSGCYNHTIEKGYRFLLADFINAKSAGAIMAQYVTEQGYSKAAFCHSDTEYEEDELKGFQAVLNETSTVLVDTVVGPFTQEEFDIAYARWEALGVDVVCVSNYYVMNSDLVRMLREKGSDIQVVSDYVMETNEDIERNGTYLEGTVIVPLYIYQTAEVGEIQQRFQERYQVEMLEVAAQAYDLVDMLARQLSSGVTSSEKLMEGLKSQRGYDGILGTVRFDDNGALIAQDCRLLVFTEGAFRLVEKKGTT